ncbi:hypothetical protein WS68_04080 [Burkholderia sp. TSV86]|nr:hypothetical protein WS68_04080 [Burkholderia sp. TSV86]
MCRAISPQTACCTDRRYRAYRPPNPAAAIGGRAAEPQNRRTAEPQSKTQHENPAANQARATPDQAAGSAATINVSTEESMLRYALVFFIVAIVAALFGFGGIAAGAAEIAKILFYLFAVIFIVTLLLGIVRR